MGAIQGIGPWQGGITPALIRPQDSSPPAPAQGSPAAGSTSVLSLASTSVNAASEAILASDIPMLASNEAIGAVLLLLILQYLQSTDPAERQQILDTVLALSGMLRQDRGSSANVLFYSSSDVSIESTQLALSTTEGLNAYSGSAANLRQAPPPDAGAAGLDVLA